VLNKKHSGRKSQRSMVTPFEIKGSVTDASGNQSEIVLIWNISDDGLCLWGLDKVKRGDQVQLRITHPWEIVMSCVVRWTRSIPDRSGFLIGLEALNHRERLAQLHKEITSQGHQAV